MSDAAPPPWVKRAPNLSAAHKFMLSVLWGYGPYAGRSDLWFRTADFDLQPKTPVRCWEPCSKIAELTDQSEGTVRKQLRKLAADGWILRGKGSMRTLAWRAPGVFAYGAGVPEGQGPTPEYPVPTGTPPVHTGPPGDHEVPPKVTTEGPQTLQELSNSTSKNVGDAGARPDTWPTECATHGSEWCSCPPTHRDFKPAKPAPEEHTHGDTHQSGTRSRTGLGGVLAPAGERARPPLPAHVVDSLARAARGPAPAHAKPPRPIGAGDDTRGASGRRDAGASVASPGRLTPEIAEAVAAAGDVWAVQLGQAHFEKCVRETVDDLGLTPGELTKGLLGWETMDRARRPPRSGWLYARNRRAFKAAAGLEAPPEAKRSGLNANPMDGGLRVVNS